MEHHGEIAVWALGWCFWVFFYSIISFQWYLMDLWVNENVIHDDSDDEDTYLIQFWDFDDNE